MLAYRSATRRASASALLDEIVSLLDATGHEGASIDDWTELLIAVGEVESAISDAVLPERDDVTALTTALNRLTRAVATAAVRAWEGDDATYARAEVRTTLDNVRGALDLSAFPAELEIGVPEGFAYYGLYPETYAAAARELLGSSDVQRIACIGIRSIGATLGGVVAAVAHDAGRDVTSYTVRPRGHPFDRVISAGDELRARLERDAAAGALFLIVDEGPGLSGSSFASVAELISGLAVPDDRIIFIPSWIPAAESLRSSRGRERWRRHRSVSVPFEQVLEREQLPLELGRLVCGSAAQAESLGAGTWRRVLYADERDWPAAQPQHERRKYLLRDAHGRALALLKFEGLGRYGRAATSRARKLAEARLAPRVLGMRRGFLATEWVDGTPAREGDADPALLDAIAANVAHRATAMRDEQTVPFDKLLEIIRINTGESLGTHSAASLVEALEPCRAIMRYVRTCATDGRMLPHEWIRTVRGWVKLDGVDHRDDHFLPGHQDPAWDIAGAIVELLLDRNAARDLVAAYQRRSGDRDVAAKLPFLRIAYLATRLGYVTLAAESLGDDPDAVRLGLLVRRYTAMLRRCAVEVRAIPAMPLPPRWSGVRAIAFDADDTLRCTTVAGQPCPHAPSEWRLLPWLADGALTQLPWGERLALGIASNQDHVGYGHLTERQARELLVSMAVEATGVVPDRDGVQFCPHVLEIACECRKPAPGMLRAITEHFRAAPDAVLFVGNAASDAEAARRAGVRFTHIDEFSAELAACVNDTHAMASPITASAA